MRHCTKLETVWYRHKNRHTGQWNSKEMPEMNLLYGQFIFDKAAKYIQWKEDSLFNKWC